jgi:hypothetical protein
MSGQISHVYKRTMASEQALRKNNKTWKNFQNFGSKCNEKKNLNKSGEEENANDNITMLVHSSAFGYPELLLLS